jgi:GAF domain-containing protein
MDDVTEELGLISCCAMDHLDSPRGEPFDRFTELAVAAFSVLSPLVSRIDAERQWFKSHHGLCGHETPLSQPCFAYTIESDLLFLVTDNLIASLCAANALVPDSPHIRFYACHPTYNSGQRPVGTFCIIDTAQQFSGRSLQ